MIEGPFERGGYPVWEDRLGEVEVRFVGAGKGAGRDEVLARIGEPDLVVAWAKQIHSARVLPAAAAGERGEGDALTTGRNGFPGLALAVVTADCVPVVLAGPPGDPRIAAVHAGWRGIVSGVIPATLEALGEPTLGHLKNWTAWIGPAIGPCCYEVGDEVAEQIAAASTPEAVVPAVPAASAGAAGAGKPGGRPHLDLLRAATHQLRAAGVSAITSLPLCTRCESNLSSYRREGKGGGRNISYIWRRSTASPAP
jgi:YfiH family protein